MTSLHFFVVFLNAASKTSNISSKIGILSSNKKAEVFPQVIFQLMEWLGFHTLKIDFIFISVLYLTGKIINDENMATSPYIQQLFDERRAQKARQQSQDNDSEWTEE
jgi:hypothetical protein